MHTHLHRSDVRVHEDGVDVLLFQRLDGLGATVIELSGLTDAQTSTSEHKNFLHLDLLWGKREWRREEKRGEGQSER